MSNQYITTEYTQVLAGLLTEVQNDPSTYLGSKYLPAVSHGASVIRYDIKEASGGLTNEHLVGTNPKSIQGTGWRTQEFAPGAYKEEIIYNEKDIISWRKKGVSDLAMRGIRQQIAEDVDKLNRRIDARIEQLRWDAIFTGGFSYLGQTFSFGIPAANQATPIGAVWSSDGIGANNSANPLIDLRYWLNGGLAAFRKYKVTKIIMNPNTSRWFMDNTNVRSYVQNALANPSVKQYGINDVLGFFLPDCPPVEIYSGWYQNESVVSGRVLVGDAIYFIPNGYIFFECALPGADKIGEFEKTLNLAEGSIDNPSSDKFLIVEDNTAPQSKGGPQNPFISVVGGVYGGPNLKRSFDVLTAKVIA